MDESKTRFDWRAAETKLKGLSEEEQRIIRLLVAGRTQPEIAEQLGMHRSAVWRRVTKLRKRLVLMTGLMQTWE